MIGADGLALAKSKKRASYKLLPFICTFWSMSFCQKKGSAGRPKQPVLDLLLRSCPDHSYRDFLDLRASAGEFDLNRQNVVAQEFRR